MNDTNSSYKWAADSPLTDIDEDKLGRSDFAEKIARSINAYRYNKDGSLVIGIHGEWGTGKTTLKNFILGELKLPVVEFNPWQLSSQDKVLEGFFKEIVSVFNPKNFKDRKKAKNLIRGWKQFSQANLAKRKIVTATSFTILVVVALIFVGIGFLPFEKEVKTFLDFILLLFLIAKAIKDYFNWKPRARSLNEAREYLRSEFENLEMPILVVIDDLDRLTNEEIQLIIQLVKANANFPNMIYLLLFQKDVVAKALDEISSSSGMEYLEKIVQIDLQVPTAPDTAMRNMFEDGLEAIWGKYVIKWSEEDQNRWVRILEEGIWPFFETPRDIKRFLNAFAFYFSIHAREGSLDVNKIDLVIVEVLRMFHHHTYRMVAGSWSNRRPLSLLIYSDAEEFRKKLAKDFHKLLEDSKLDQVKKTCLNNLFYELLPHVQENAHVVIASMDRDRRLCHQKHYSKYFKLDLDPEEVSAATIAELVKATNSLEKVTDMLKGSIQKGQFISLLERLKLEEEGIPKNSPEKIALIERIGRALFDISDSLPQLKGYLGFSKHGENQLSETVVKLLTRVDDPLRRDSIAETIVTKTHTITGPVFFVEFVQSYNNNQPDGFDLLSSDSLEKIKDMLVRRLWEFAKSGKLWELEGISTFLQRLAEWDNEEKVQTWLKKEIENSSKAAKFVRHILWETSSSRGLSYAIYPNFWKKIVDLRKLVDNAKRVKSDEPTKTAVEKLTSALDKADSEGTLPEKIDVISRLWNGTYESISEDF